VPLPFLFWRGMDKEKGCSGEAAAFFVWKGNNEEGEEKERFVPSHGGEEAKALQRKNGGSFLC